ncbi:hypothetical protein Ddc_07812 [Ditylenchus destructor]|nr:hypothetical protein Ddc_07812 [Ditylenchus destructor]
MSLLSQAQSGSLCVLPVSEAATLPAAGSALRSLLLVSSLYTAYSIEQYRGAALNAPPGDPSFSLGFSLVGASSSCGAEK